MTEPSAGEPSEAPAIRFKATLHRPVPTAKDASGIRGDWSFLNLPKEASQRLPSRGMVSVQGTLNGVPFIATLDPDGQGGHWLKVDRKLRTVAVVQVGEEVTLDITPVSPENEPEPKVPADLRTALAAAPEDARKVWADITPIARRDWVQWIVSAKQAQTQARRIASACDMLAKGKRRPCCFDRSGMYGASLSCPTAEDDDA